MKFIGIDLGWSSGASGLCCLVWENSQLQLTDLDCKLSTVDILDWVDQRVPEPEPGLVAVDAPTLIPNATGMRLPDKLTHRYFGRYHAGCYPANLKSRFASHTVGFGKSLEARGFMHAPMMIPQRCDRYQIEVFPHPAMINLFGLSRILKYKKGKLADRRLELIKLRQYIVEVLPNLEPSLSLNSSAWILSDSPDSFINQLAETSSKLFKAIEDQLDAILCAYIGAHWWYWGCDRNLVLGVRTDPITEAYNNGYIVIPNRPSVTQITDVGAIYKSPLQISHSIREDR
jgi:predicted RNase H-like nuclease